MSIKFDVRHSEAGLLGETRIFAEFRTGGHFCFTAQGTAEVSTTAAYVKTIQHWATVSIVTYYFSDIPVALAQPEAETGVVGLLLQRRCDARLTRLCTETDGELSVLLVGEDLVIVVGEGSAPREVLREPRASVSVLHLELPPAPTTRAASLATSVHSLPQLGGPEPVRLVAA